MTIKEKSRLDYLDVLRGIAVLAVCVYHIFGFLNKTNEIFHPIQPYIKFLLADSVNWGLFGVVLFFLISGYIIPNSLKPGTTLNKFIISRTFRLYPAYWVTLILILISAPYLGHIQPTYSFAQFIANVTMVPRLFGFIEMSGVFWTLFIEILFYVCCAALFLLKWLDKPIYIAIIGLGFNMTTPAAIILNKLFHLGIPVQFVLFHLSFLFAGNLLRLAVVRNEKSAKYFSLLFILVCFFTVPIVTGFYFPVSEAIKAGLVMFNPESTVLSYCLAIGLFIYTISFRSLTNKFMIGLGEISYSLYLLHMHCFIFVAKFISPVTLLGLVSFLVVSAFLSYWIAKLSFICIESRAIEIGRRIIKSR